MSDMKAYLAAKYMSGPKADAILARSAPKKKKRKHATDASTSASTSFLKDDDGGWGDDPNAMAVDEDNDVHEAVVASDRGFKKRKVNTGWQTVQKPLEEEDMPDEKPQVVEEETEKPFAGGLVSASRLKKVLPGSAPAAPTITAEEEALAQETVYRDASGRKIDTKAAKAEAARKKREKDEKEAEKMEWGKGLVQREEKERIRQEMLKNRSKGFARHADDEDLNEEQKQKELWNDPAAAFLSSVRVLHCLHPPNFC